MSVPETSIVVRTFNEERHLPGLMEAIHAQRYRDFEVVNVDSGSYDRTTQIAEQYGARVQRINSEDFTFGYSLNVGIEAAAGLFVVIVSAHTKPVDEHWLERLVEPLKEDEVAMVYGRQKGVDTSKYGEMRDLDRTFGPRRTVLKPPRFFANNANSALSKELWEKHRFGEDLPGQEDIEWAKYWMERGRKVVYEPAACIYHIHNETWRQVRRRYYGEAVATRAIGVWRRRDAIPLTLREVGYLATDMLSALGKGEGMARGSEIVRFRINKAYGTVSGLLDGKAMETAVGRDSLFFDRKCKAVVVHGRDQVSLDEIDVPTPKPGEVLLEVAYAGVAGADLRLSTRDDGHPGSRASPDPIIPGFEVSGWVVQVGANVNHLNKGDAVVVQPVGGCGKCEACRASDPAACQDTADALDARATLRAYADYLSAPGRFVYKLPAGADMKRAVLCGPLAMALKGLRKVSALVGHTGDRSRFAVVGCGPIGHLCARVLSARGHPVTVFDRNPRRLGYFEHSPIAVGSDTGDLRRFDVLVEATGDPGALQRILETSRPGATIVLLGLPYSRRRFVIQGGWSWDKAVISSVGAEPEDFQRAIALLPQLPMDDLTDCVFPMTEFALAWDMFRTGEHPKVLLKAHQTPMQ